MLCAGDACDVVAVAWSPGEGLYVVTNRSTRAVLVRFHSWGTVTRLVLEPLAVQHLDVSDFDIPYHASYVEGPDA